MIIVEVSSIQILNMYTCNILIKDLINSVWVGVWHHNQTQSKSVPFELITITLQSQSYIMYIDIS